MTHKNPNQRRAYERARYHKRKLAMGHRDRERLASDPRSCAGLLRKGPGKAQRKISNPEKYVENILTWIDRKGVE